MDQRQYSVGARLENRSTCYEVGVSEYIPYGGLKLRTDVLRREFLTRRGMFWSSKLRLVNLRLTSPIRNAAQISPGNFICA